MKKLIFHPELIGDKAAFAALCPFGAIEHDGDSVAASAGCKMCGICVKKGNGGAEILETPDEGVDKSLWRDVCVYADQTDGRIHPVTFELLGKAASLAAVTGQKTCCLLIGSNVGEAAQELLHYGVDRVFVYDHPDLAHFRIEPYTAVFADMARKFRPCAILVGATVVGRQLAPRVAARLRTGLTADCTTLEMRPDTDLVQIRPAFGGNIMAQIHTPNHRPQMATVRYRVMDAPARAAQASGRIVSMPVTPDMLVSGVRVLRLEPVESAQTIETAEVIVAVGRAFTTEASLAPARELAALLGGQLAGTRPMVENGLIDPRRQIGLSGRTVRPRLLIACGISGAVQFTAGMSNSECIFAINSDPAAPIFNVANYAAVGDVFEVLETLIDKIKAERGAK